MRWLEYFWVPSLPSLPTMGQSRGCLGDILQILPHIFNEVLWFGPAMVPWSTWIWYGTVVFMVSWVSRCIILSGSSIPSIARTTLAVAVRLKKLVSQEKSSFLLW